MQHAALVRIEAGEQAVVDLVDRRVEGHQALLALARNRDDVPASVGRIPATFDQTLGLEIVQQSDQLHRIDLDGLGKTLLARFARTQGQQRVQVPGLDPRRLQRRRESPHRRLAQGGNQLADRGAGSRLGRISLLQNVHAPSYHV